MKPATLAITGVEKSFGAVRALAGVDLSVGSGELLTILGPSGSGKTTLLKAIAGFDVIDAGVITIEGRDITRISPARRDIGMVFQNYALFPHMKVEDNVAFPLRMRHCSRTEVAEKVAWALDLVELRGFERRYPSQLSGGQQQRVALARAIVFGPKLLLLDEPFGALDRKLREAMQLEVRRLQQRLGLTTVFITHDQEEALILSDRIGVMREGEIKQVGAPEEVYTRPADVFVADFVGESNLLRGRIEQVRDGLARIRASGGRTVLACTAAAFAAGDEATLLIRPEAARRIDPAAPPDNVFAAEVVEAIYLGNAIKYRLATRDGLDLLVRWPASGRADALPLGTRIEIGWSAEDGHLLRHG
jgi:putative spermidine/putrescine transport system ATP-binding protein